MMETNTAVTISTVAQEILTLPPDHYKVYFTLEPHYDFVFVSFLYVFVCVCFSVFVFVFVLVFVFCVCICACVCLNVKSWGTMARQGSINSI